MHEPARSRPLAFLSLARWHFPFQPSPSAASSLESLPAGLVYVGGKVGSWAGGRLELLVSLTALVKHLQENLGFDLAAAAIIMKSVPPQVGVANYTYTTPSP